MSKLVRLVALDALGGERGVIDGERLSIWVTEDNELQVTNGMDGRMGEGIVFGWEDLVPDFRRGERIHLKLEIIDEEG